MIDDVTPMVIEDIGVWRTWENTWFGEGWGNVRIFDNPKNAKLAIRQDIKYQNGFCSHWEGDRFIRKRQSGLDRLVTPSDYKIVRIRITAEPLSQIEWEG